MVKRFKKYQIDSLKSAFKQSQHLTKNKKIELVTATGLDVEQIISWFNRNRAKKRARKSIGDLELTKAELQQALQALREGQEREVEIQKELQARKKKEAELRAVNQDLKHQLAIVGGESGDSHFDHFLWSSHGPGSTQSNNLPRS